MPGEFSKPVIPRGWSRLNFQGSFVTTEFIVLEEYFGSRLRLNDLQLCTKQTSDK